MEIRLETTEEMRDIDFNYQLDREDPADNAETLVFRKNVEPEDAALPVKSESVLEEWQTPAFEEDLNKTFICPTKDEFIYLIKGIFWEKNISVKIHQSATRHYLLIAFLCSGVDECNHQLTYNPKKKPHQLNGAGTCPFYIQYVEDPENQHHYRVHSFFDKHRHKFTTGMRIPNLLELQKYFLGKKAESQTYQERGKTPFRNTGACWKHHFLRSVEYEITVIHGEEFRFRQRQVAEETGRTSNIHESPITIEQALNRPSPGNKKMGLVQFRQSVQQRQQLTRYLCQSSMHDV